MNSVEATLVSNGYRETVWLYGPLYLRGNILRLETDAGQLWYRSQYCGFGRRFGSKYCINLCGYTSLQSECFLSGGLLTINAPATRQMECGRSSLMESMPSAPSAHFYRQRTGRFSWAGVTEKQDTASTSNADQSLKAILSALNSQMHVAEMATNFYGTDEKPTRAQKQLPAVPG